MLFDKDNSKKETATSVSRLALACADAVLGFACVFFWLGETHIMIEVAVISSFRNFSSLANVWPLAI